MDDGGREGPAGRRPPATLIEEALRGGWVEVVGSSMEPLMPRGARVRLRPPGGRPRLGALVLFPWRDGLTVHRVVGGRGERLRTKGDRALRADPGLRDPVDVLGVVEAARHEGRRADLCSPRWRLVGLVVALHSRAWDLLAAPWPGRTLDTGGGVLARLLRRGLRAGNVALPRLVGWSLRGGLWQARGDAGGGD